MQRIVVLNPKGGSGKTTIAINLASYYAVQGLNPVLMDYDPQGSSIRWLKKRAPPLPQIHGIAAYERNSRTTRSFQLMAPGDSLRQVVDTAAAIEPHDMPELTRGADAILVPVLPSDIDIHACSKCIADLLLVAKVKRTDNRIAVIANRVKKHTLIYQSLMRFLATLQIPIVATFRDSQNYIRAAELGVGIHEMKPYLVREDLDQWGPLIAWLESRGSDGNVAAAPSKGTAAPALNGAVQAGEAIAASMPATPVAAVEAVAGEGQKAPATAVEAVEADAPASPATEIESVVVEEPVPATTDEGSGAQ